MSPSVPLLLSLALVGLSIVVILWWVPRWEIDRAGKDLEKADQVDLEIKARGVLAQILGGLFLLLGLYSTYQSFELSRRGQVSERLMRAAELLGNHEKEVRVAGIALLGNIADDYPDERWPVMDILAVYIRQASPWPPDPGFVRCKSRAQAAQLEAGIGEPYASPDIQAALDILKRQDWSSATRPLNLQNADLQGADLKDGNLQKVFFNKSYLGGAELSGLDMRGDHLANVCAEEYTQCVGAKMERVEVANAQLSGLSGCKIGAN